MSSPLAQLLRARTGPMTADMVLHPADFGRVCLVELFLPVDAEIFVSWIGPVNNVEMEQLSR